jgi:hypothetical protein
MVLAVWRVPNFSASAQLSFGSFYSLPGQERETACFPPRSLRLVSLGSIAKIFAPDLNARFSMPTLPAPTPLCKAQGLIPDVLMGDQEVCLRQQQWQPPRAALSAALRRQPQNFHGTSAGSMAVTTAARSALPGQSRSGSSARRPSPSQQVGIGGSRIKEMLLPRPAG